MPIGTNFMLASAALPNAANPWDNDALVAPAPQQGNPWDHDEVLSPAPSARPGVIMGAPKLPTIVEDRNYGLSVRSAERQDDAASRAADAAARAAANDQRRVGLDATREQREAANAARTIGNTTFDNVSNMRKEFTGRQEVKDFQIVLPQVASAMRIAQNPNSTGADDLNLIYTFGKVMDPGSVVREGELALASQTGSFAQNMEGAVSRLENGERLPAEVRHNLVESMRRRGIEMAHAYNQSRGQYQGMAERNGFNPLDIVGEHPATPYQQAEADFTKHTIGNLDGQPAVRPTGYVPPAGAGPEGDIGFSGKEAAAFDPQQEAAMAGFFKHNPNATPDQINGFAQQIGLGHVENAQQLADYYRKGGRGFGGVERDRSAEHAAAAKLAAAGGRGGAQDLIMQGASFGLADEISGAANGVVGAATGDFDFGKNYRIGREATDIGVDQARKDLGYAGTAAEVAGGLITMNPEAAIGAIANPSLLGRIGTGARAGAIGGGVGGFGYGRDAEGSLGGAALGAGAGAALGGALPFVGETIGGAVSGARRLAGRDPNVARQIVGNAIEADGSNPAAIEQLLREAQERGSPMAIGDSGENARALLASVGRQPGASRTVTRDAVVGRQMEQGDRISSAATRDLGEAPNIRDTGDTLIARARDAAGPLYEQAYAAPNVHSANVEGLLSRPSMRSALARAHRIAQEEGEDPTALGLVTDVNGDIVLNPAPVREMSGQAAARAELTAAQDAYRTARGTAGSSGPGDLNAARTRMEAAREKLRTADAGLKAAPVEGEAAQKRGYTWKTLDYVKRGMDDVIETKRNPVTGKLNLDEEGRAVNSTLRTFLSRVDKINPTYGEARAAYAGPARMKGALDKGAKALNQSADDVAATIAGLGSDSEKQMFQSGFRKAIADMLENRTDGGDKVQALLGTPKKRRALQSVFGGKAEFDRFIATLQDERAMGETYKSVATGSQTAERGAIDAQTGDDGLIQDAVGDGLRAVKRGIVPALVTGIEKLRGVSQFGAGQAGRDARRQVAETLIETDPEMLAEITRATAADRARRTAAAQRSAKRAAPVGLQIGRSAAGIGSKHRKKD